MALGDPAVTHVPQETGASTSLPQVSFRIYDSSLQNEIDVQISDRQHVRSWSLGFRKLMDEAAPSNVIPVNIVGDSIFDCTAVAWVLEEQQGRHRDIPENLSPETLARHCAVLWEYKCNPDDFKHLGVTMPLKSSSASPSVDRGSSSRPSSSSSGSSWSWCGKKNEITCGSLITIALVLGLKDIVEGELKSAVWGTDKKVTVSIPLMVDIEAIRREELGRLFTKVSDKIVAFQKHNMKLAESIRKTLEEREIADFWNPWSENAKKMEEDKWTPFVFLRAMERALAPLLQPQGHEAQSGKLAVAIGKEVPPVHWISGAQKLVRVIRHKIEGKEIGSDQDEKNGILVSLDALISERCTAVAEDLMTKRNSIVQEWKSELNELDGLNH